MNEKDAAAGAAQKVFGREWIGEGCRVQALALIADLDYECIAGVLKGSGDVFFGVVGVAMEDGVDGAFADSHADAEDLILIEAGALSHLLGGLLEAIDAIQGRVEGVAD